MPEIKIILTPGEVNQINLHNKNIVIIDTLRTGTTIVAALANGIRTIYPFAKIGSLIKFYNKQKNKDLYICAGEDKGRKIEGFALGNSPLSFTNSKFTGKIMLLKTSNGTAVLSRIRKINSAYIGGLVNSSKIAELIINRGQDVYLLCAGSAGAFSLEDFFTAGRYCYLLKKAGWRGDDLTNAAQRIYEDNSEYSEIVNLFYLSRNGQNLLHLGSDKDIELASRIDIYNTVPIFDGNKIRPMSVDYLDIVDIPGHNAQALEI